MRSCRSSVPSSPATSSGRSTTRPGRPSPPCRRDAPPGSRSPRSCALPTPTPARASRSGSPGRVSRRRTARSVCTRTGAAASRRARSAATRRRACGSRSPGCTSADCARGSSPAEAGTWTRAWRPLLAELGLADCTATAFRPSYLAPDAPRLALVEPARLRLGEAALIELPATHSLGMAARGALRRLPAYVHVYFHDTDLLDRRRARALEWALRIIGRRRRPERLDRLDAEQELDFSAAASGL